MSYKRHYIVLDAAKMQNHIKVAKHFNQKFMCLYKGEAEEKLGTVAPWLFTYPKPSIFSDWYLSRSGQQHWGIIVETQKDFKTVYLHLKKFLMVKTEAGKKLYFRFYDPRVLPTFLETSDGGQLSAFFGPIDKYILESVKGEIVEYTLTDGRLNKNKSNFFFENKEIVSQAKHNEEHKNKDSEDFDWGL